MSLLGMPYAFINLGCQMLYVLHQRLGAQGIPPDKGAKVLHDLVATMFEPAFLADKLFVPQDMYSLLSTRKVFDKIAHSSIMKLSSNSMEKLFDLMVMGAKACLLCSARLDDMLAVTLRHLSTVRALLVSAAAGVDGEAIRLLSNAEDATQRFYGGLSAGEAALLRATLARFFQDKRVRVSLFLAEGIQLHSGKLVMASCLDQRVGLVRSYEAGRLVAEERLQLASQQVPSQEFFCHPVPLGDNLYCKDRPKVVPPARPTDQGGRGGGSESGAADAAAAAAAAASTQQPEESPAADGDHKQYEQEHARGIKAAAQELDFLAALVHGGRQPQPASASDFRLNLLVADDDEDLLHSAAAAQPQQVPVKAGGRQQHLQFGSGGRALDAHAARLGEALDAVQLSGEGDGVDEEGGDLLDLLDSVAEGA